LENIKTIIVYVITVLLFGNITTPNNLSHIFLYVTLNTKSFMKQHIKVLRMHYYSLIIILL